MADEKKGSLLMALGMGPEADSPGVGGDGGRDADAKRLKRALEAGDGDAAYSVIHDWVLDCLDEMKSEPSKEEEDREGESTGY